jgi:hypothetical protein
MMCAEYVRVCNRLGAVQTTAGVIWQLTYSLLISKIGVTSLASATLQALL